MEQWKVVTTATQKLWALIHVTNLTTEKKRGVGGGGWVLFKWSSPNAGKNPKIPSKPTSPGH